MEELRKMRKPTQYNKQCSRYSGLNPGLTEYRERVFTSWASIRERDYISYSYKTSTKSLSLWLRYAFCRFVCRKSETSLKRNLDITEKCHEQKTFIVPRACCPRFQPSSRCMKRNLPATDKISIPFHFLRGRFHCINDYKYEILDLRLKESGDDSKTAGYWPKHVATSRISYKNMALYLCK